MCVWYLVGRDREVARTEEANERIVGFGLSVAECVSFNLTNHSGCVLIFLNNIVVVE